MLATLILTVTLTLPGIGPRSTTIEFQMPDLQTCERKGHELEYAGDEMRTFRYVCRRDA